MLSPIELDAAPKITLAGKDYPIPLLVPRQNRIVIPKLLSLMKALTAGDAVKIVDPTNLSTAEYDDLIDIVWIAVTRATPTLTKEQFLDMPIGLMELISAMDTVALQSGAMKRSGEAKPDLGEASAAGTGSPIGTASSPE